ncbi:hypothetical protein [Peribacillus kribbensis]|uniref:hypothetical protein n=1 Tax=Peribacillus kribbensis TaxID=356658 RepID=UPI000416D72A|nr:hypothetical protein [Peribacillus kribbensis]
MMEKQVNSFSRGNSKLLRGLLYGAAAGGALAMFDRGTRMSFMDGSRKTYAGMKSFFKNPMDGLARMGEFSGRLRTQIEEISDDLTFISEKVDELKEVPIQVAEVVMETKDVLTHDGHAQMHEGSMNQASQITH